MHPFSFATTAQLICEPGSSRRLASLCKERGARSVLVVTDPGITRFGLLDEVLPGFETEGLQVAVYDQVVADPPEHIVLAAVAQARASRVDLIIGFGGGSSMDVAKLVALLAHPDCAQSLQDIYGVGNAKGQRLPLIQVPTTAGTGSEVTQIAIITTGETTKMGVVSPLLLPDLALLDADLTLGLPPAVTAATGIDAMVHAIEAYTSALKKNPMSDLLAREALRLLAANLDEAVHNGSNREARQAMLLGACLAGRRSPMRRSPPCTRWPIRWEAISTFPTACPTPWLPQVLRFNVSAAAHYGELAPIILGERLRTGDPSTYAEQLIEEFEQMSARVGLPTRLRDAGVPEDAAAAGEGGDAAQRLLVNNPREVSEADALAIYQAAY